MSDKNTPEAPQSVEISPEKVHELAPQIAAGHCLLIDCREEDEWQINHLPSAILSPLSSFATDIAKLLPKQDIPCIVYCHHGMRSMRAVEYLRSHGHSAAWSMTGGINAWSETIDPSVPKY